MGVTTLYWVAKMPPMLTVVTATPAVDTVGPQSETNLQIFREINLDVKSLDIFYIKLGISYPTIPWLIYPTTAMDKLVKVYRGD